MGDSTIVLCMLRRIGYILLIKHPIFLFSFSNNGAIGAVESDRWPDETVGLLQNKLIFRALTTAADETLHALSQLLKPRQVIAGTDCMRVETVCARAIQAIVEWGRNKLKIS